MLDQTNFYEGPDGNIYCKSCYKVAIGIMDVNQTAKYMVKTTHYQVLKSLQLFNHGTG